LGGYAPKNSFVEKQRIGTVSIKEGTNTITVVLKNTDERCGVSKFLLHRIYLEKISRDGRDAM
jgi:hypothetical protein